MQGILLQIGYFERGLSKRFKKVNFIFLSNRMSLACTCILCVCYWYVPGMYSYVIRMSLVCTRMSTVCYSYVLICHPYVTRMYSFVVRMSLVGHSYVTCMYSYVIRMPLVCGFTKSR